MAIEPSGCAYYVYISDDMGWWWCGWVSGGGGVGGSLGVVVWVGF
jgi:hypothetical protein